MKRILIIALLTLLSFLVAASLALAAEVWTPAVERPQNQSFIGYTPKRIVVKFDPSITHTMNGATLAQGKTGIATLDDFGTRHGVASIRRQFPGAKRKNYKGRVIDLAGWHKVEFRREVQVLDIVEEYKKIPGVIDAQPVSIHTVYREPTEQFYDLQWHLPRIQAPEAWDIETGNSNIIVAILDTGVRYFQKDLGGVDASPANPTAADGNMWVNLSEKNGTDGADDDGNGYVDDWIGWDFVENTYYGPLYPCYAGEDCGVPDNDPRDFNGHGTHCAGSVAAMNNNDEAVASVAGGWGSGTPVSSGNGVKVMPLRIGWSVALLGIPDLEVGVVEMDYAAEALYYAADNGARIASCSWGSENTGGIADAIDYFLASGGLIFKAAGNDDSSTPDYMGSRDDIINVAATDESDCKASFSNYGNWVDIAAPGVYIWSLFHDHTDPETDYVAPLDGTSMAAPLAASVAALTWSLDPSLSAQEVKEILYRSADPIDGLGCNSMYAGELGAGRINAHQAVHLTPTADFAADSTCGYDSLTVTFTDESTGGVTDWLWDFGDGSTSSEQHPTYTYGAPGTYTVKLEVFGPYGSDDEVKVDFITVNVPAADLNMEIGEISVLDHNWQQVNFSRCFVDPVVVAKPLSYNGIDPSVVRVRNVGGRGFEIRVQEWDYLNGVHTIPETVSYVVVERGIHFLADGTQVEAGSFMTNLTSSFGTFSFDQSFRVVPVMMAAVASFNEAEAVTTRLRNITTGGFEFRMQEQEANVEQSHNVETIHYIAWEPAMGTVNDLSFEVATTGDEVTDQLYPISFSTTFLEGPRFFADMQTTDGTDTAAMRWQNKNPYGIEVKIEEETSFDSETTHVTEVVGYMAFSASSVQ